MARFEGKSTLQGVSNVPKLGDLGMKEPGLLPDYFPGQSPSGPT